MIRIYMFGGDLLDKPAGMVSCEDWVEASKVIKEAVENGLLVSVIHSDFEVPEHRFDEMLEAVGATMTAAATSKVKK